MRLMNMATQEQTTPPNPIHSPFRNCENPEPSPTERRHVLNIDIPLLASARRLLLS